MFVHMRRHPNVVFGEFSSRQEAVESLRDAVEKHGKQILRFHRIGFLEQLSEEDLIKETSVPIPEPAEKPDLSSFDSVFLARIREGFFNAPSYKYFAITDRRSPIIEPTLKMLELGLLRQETVEIDEQETHWRLYLTPFGKRVLYDE